MCFPKAPPPPAPAPIVTDFTASKETLIAADEQRKKAAMAAGMQSNIKTSAQGDTSQAPTKMKTLLGG